MPRFGNLEISLGLNGISGEQELWRFLTLEKAHDLFRSGELYLRQVTLLRLMDDRESRLPKVIHQRFREMRRGNLRVQRFMEGLLDKAEDQAKTVYASCWYMPDALENYEHMWREFGGGEEGGVCLVTTVERLGVALIDNPLSIGLVQYVDPDMTFAEAFALNQYRSCPFLLKMASYHLEKEARLYKRRAWTPQPDCQRERVSLPDLISCMKLSPLVSDARNREISHWFTRRECGFPEDRLLMPKGQS